jgi:ribA/ribD-fused uncharacterized protein
MTAGSLAPLPEWVPQAVSTIVRFEGDYEFLSMDYRCAIQANGARWPTAAHLYQAAKTSDHYDIDRIRSAFTPRKARLIGFRITRRKGWRKVKKLRMLEIAFAKFVQHPDLAALLVATGDRPLVAGNKDHDNYWGNCRCSDCAGKPGLNYLGEILMMVRTVLRPDN